MKKFYLIFATFTAALFIIFCTSTETNRKSICKNLLNSTNIKQDYNISNSSSFVANPNEIIEIELSPCSYGFDHELTDFQVEYYLIDGDSIDGSLMNDSSIIDIGDTGGGIETDIPTFPNNY